MAGKRSIGEFPVEKSFAECYTNTVYALSEASIYRTV